MVTVASYNLPMEAELARSLLESEGIDVILRDEGVATWGMAIGGVKLQVRQSDFEAARQILQDATASEDEDPGEPWEG